MVWKGANDQKVRKYDYTYDAASRLTGANFGQYSVVGSGKDFTNTVVDYTVSGLTYDENGNILKQAQKGLLTTGTSAVIDNLSYTYATGSNKLTSVTDAINSYSGDKLGDFQDGNKTGIDYSYDVNGNMTTDKNKNISQITYNILNLPSVIRVIGTGTAGKGTIRYYYDATGNKLRKVTIDSTTLPARQTVTTYIGGGVYQNDTLKFFGMGEGRIRPNTANTAFVYDYFLKDHLGNTRMVVTDDYSVASPILEASSYYPFGLQQKTIGLTASGKLHNYKKTFQGQEFKEDLGVNIDEFKYRMDDPQIGRFWQVDPLADKYVYNSTYAFSENRVTTNIELEGIESAQLVMPKDLTQQQVNDVYTGMNKGYTKTLLATGLVTYGIFSILFPEVMGPVSASILFGVPSPTAPTSLASTATTIIASDVSTITSESEELATVYRGVNETHPGYESAVEGKAVARGGDATPEAHNAGNTASNYTSWTTDREVAQNYALRP